MMNGRELHWGGRVKKRHDLPSKRELDGRRGYEVERKKRGSSIGLNNKRERGTLLRATQ